MNQTGVYKLSKGPDKKERTNHDDYVGMQKGAYFKKNVLFSLLHFRLVLTPNYKKIFENQHVY